MAILKKKQWVIGREPGFSGYGNRLTIKRS